MFVEEYLKSHAIDTENQETKQLKEYLRQRWSLFCLLPDDKQDLVVYIFKQELRYNVDAKMFKDLLSFMNVLKNKNDRSSQDGKKTIKSFLKNYL